jgi:hypothetical protein
MRMMLPAPTRLLAGGFVARRIPRVANAPPFGVEHQRFVDTLLRRHHPELPVFGDHGHPVAGQVHGGCGARRWRRPTAATPLRLHASRNQ